MIDRRTLLASASACTALAALPQPLRATSTNLPNIVFIMADDLGYADLGCTGSRMNRTPHIDSLAANGRFFTQGYANSSICSPTRTGLLTGCYQYRFAAGLEEPIGPGSPQDIGVPHDWTTMPEVLRGLGYQTALVGKWHLGNPPLHNPLTHGYDHFFGIVPGGADYFRHHAVVGGRDVGVGLMQGDAEIERAGYLTDLFGDEAVRVIREKSGPLFLSLHFTAPHWPWEGREDEEVARTLGNFMHFDGGSLETYANMVAALDDNVGKVLAALREIGELDNTLIVFTSDNGGERFSDTWPFAGMKGELLEGGIRVPLLAQWPARIAAGTRSEQVAISMDFLPTFAALAGGSLPANTYDGIDIGPQLIDGAVPVERTLFWRMASNGGMAAVRSGDWKYLATGDEQHLFNLALDPRERANRMDAEPETFQRLRAQWDAWNAQMLPYPLGSYRQDNRPYFSDRY
ncbi:MAG: sulfatase-like hydrolase/transferase [Erythrobacter sp.]|nr:MAG: sulfatase-like hydrolase/transferase [Erythrobacter sp.]